MRIAILGASHWHVTQFYLPALKKVGAQVIAIHDPDPAKLSAAAGGLDCPQYTDHRELLDRERPDLVFAHAPHAHMTALAAELIARHLPFHMEKPMGVDWRELDALAVKAQTEGVWTSVPLVSRYYGAVEALRQLKEAGALGLPCHYYYRLFGSGPQRYAQWGVEWMLDPELAGAGPLWNFGPHVIDLFLYLVDDCIRDVQCWMTHAIHHLEIEDLATIRLTGQTGVQGIAEVSYSLPDGYERFLSLTTDRLHFSSAELGRGVIQHRDGTSTSFTGPGPEEVYETYVADTLTRFQAGKEAKATITDMARVLRVMHMAKASAKSGDIYRLSTAPPSHYAPAIEDA